MSADLRGVLGRVPLDHRIFIAALLPYAALRAQQAFHTHGMSVDGGYYTDVARHVRDGLGLQTNISVFHFGYPTLPHPSSVYPAWPVLLGLVGRIVPLEAAAHWLPMLLSLVAVGAMYLLGRRLWPAPVLPEVAPGVHAGHLFALGLAVHREFLVYTVLPYTEGMAWAALGLFLLRAAQQEGPPRLRWGLEAGLWLGALYLIRSQFIVVAAAFAIGQLGAVALGPARGRALGALLLCQLVVGLTLLGWHRYLSGFLLEPGLGALLRFDQHRVTDLLPPLEVIVDTPGPLDTLRDRLLGLRASFNDIDRDAYDAAYHGLHWALPMALCLAPAVLRDRLRAEAAAHGGYGPAARALLRAALARPDRDLWVFLITLAVGGFVSVHAVHKHFNGEWYFARRQGLMSLPLFLLSFGWMFNRPERFGKVVGSVIFVVVAWIGTRQVFYEASERVTINKQADIHDDLVDWLKAREREEGPLVVVMDDDASKRLGYRTRAVGYHWIEARTRLKDVLKLVDQRGARYLILRSDAREWRVLKDDPAAFAAHFDALPQRFDQMRVYRVRAPGEQP
ncbi:MAG: hypothetical protein JNM72_26970 [Deltaproteobacteria bacterium]|nr:hypothetical protein [Deltaproteobacteria bacterium]